MRAAPALLVVVLSCGLVHTRPAAAEQYAVLVGIHDYMPPGRSKRDLPGVENDLELMRQTLVRCYGFREDSRHMRLLGGTDATGSAIRQALRQVGSRVQDGDTFVFFYSGHGVYLRDQNGDESDHYDEVICPTDGVSPDTIIRDDELGEMLSRIRGQKVVILDSCFSGTGTRDITNQTVGKSFDLPGEPAVARWSGTGAPFKEIVKSRMDHILIAGCRDDQVSRVMTLDYPPNAPEHRRYKISALTYSLCLGLRGPADENGDGRITYREAADFARRGVAERFPKAHHWRGAKVQARVRPGQTVQLEGGPTDKPVFGCPRFVHLRPRIDRRDGRLLVDVGAAHGYRPGTLLTAAGGNARVRIRQLGLFASLVVSVSVAGPPAPTTPVVVDATPVPAGPVRLRVRVAISESQSQLIDLARRVAESLRRQPFLEVLDRDDDVADVAVRLHPGTSGPGYVFTLAHPGGRVDMGGSVGDSDAASLTDAVRDALAQAYAVRRLSELTNPEPSFSVRLATNRGDDQPVFRIGEQMQLCVTATADCYVTLVDVGTSGALTVLYPPAGKAPPRLKAGQVLNLPPAGGHFKVTGPPGLNRVKAIATKDKLAVSATVQTKGLGVASQVDCIMTALRDLAEPSSLKGVGDPAIPADRWAEASIGIEIE